MKHFLLLIPLCGFFLFTSCKKYEPAPEAFFIQTADVLVAVNSPTQGTTNHKITDLYLYVNGQYQGAFQAGKTMPIVSRGSKATITMLAGIKNNGIKDKSISWQFYDKIEFDTLVESGKTIQRPFTFNYNPYTKFEWMENFDALGVSLVKSVGSDTTCKIVDEGFEGKAAELGLSGNGFFAQVESSIAFPLPKGNSNVYLEINYKATAGFEVGVSDGITRKPALNINPKSEWNKIYIQLADAVNFAPAFDKHKIYFRLVKPNDDPNPRVWLDNIKLIYL